MDQELQAAQERLLEKRRQLGVTTSPIRLMSSVRHDFKIPKCKHENEHGQCPECQREEREFKERCQEEENLRIAQDLAIRRERPESWLREYGVPVKFFSSSFENFSGGKEALRACMSFPEKDIILIGKTGCGKTHLAVSTMRKMVVNREIKSARFITVPRLLMDIRDCFKDDSGESERDIVERYLSYGTLFLDDLGADRATQWAIETLYLIIDGRDSNLKPTFITTNLTIPEIEQNYGARIASRMAGKNIIKINMPDFRKKRVGAQ